MVEQGSPEWHAKRLGKVTASRMADIMAKTKSGWGASRANYRSQLVAERLRGEVLESGFTSPAMEWGTATEADARMAYCYYADTDVVLVDFVDHPTVAMSGASPDGKVGEHGLVEIKCPNTATHIETLLGQSVPGRYSLQMQWQMACTGALWCDFVSFDPRMPEDMRLFVQRVARDDGAIAELEREVRVFLAEVDERINRLVELYRPKLAAE